MLFSVVFLVVSYIFAKLFVFRANKLQYLTLQKSSIDISGLVLGFNFTAAYLCHPSRN